VLNRGALSGPLCEKARVRKVVSEHETAVKSPWLHADCCPWGAGSSVPPPLRPRSRARADAPSTRGGEPLSIAKIRTRLKYLLNW
jgi:hypothetical protein